MFVKTCRDAPRSVSDWQDLSGKGGVECSDEDPNDDEMSEKEYVQSKQPGSNFLQLLSDELSNDPTDTSDADGDKLDLLILC